MKNKLISLLLVLVMMLSLVSCAIVPPGNDEITGTETGSTPTTGTGGGTTQTPQTPVTPTYFPDMINYEATTTADGMYINYTSNYKAFVPELTKYYHGYQAALSMTFDDGYTLSTGDIVSDEFEKYGIFRGTAMLGVCWMNDTAIQKWNSVFARGYLDAGCHGWDHIEPAELSASGYEKEIKLAIEFLKTNFPTQRVLTFATPFAHINDPYQEYLDEFAISNRLAGNGTNNISSADFDIYNVSAVSYNKTVSDTTVKSKIAEAVNNGNWMVELMHGVVESGGDGVDILASTFRNHVYFLYDQYRDKIWFGSFEDVSVYVKQYQNAQIKYTACDRESMTFTIECPLDEEIYNIPMSIKVYLPNFVDSAYATVNGIYQPLTVSKDHNRGSALYVTVLDVPVNNAEVKVYLGGNKQFRNGCGTHIYSINEVVEPTHDTFGYTEKICTRCAHTYKTVYTATTCDFSGRIEEVCETTVDMMGISKVYCVHCDKYKVVKTYTLE